MRIVITILLSAALTVSAWSAELRGQVVDAATGNPIPSVSVTLAGSDGLGTMTNLAGIFRIESPVGSECRLKISHINYESRELTIKPSDELMTIRLLARSVELDPVLITGGRGKLGDTPGALTNIQHQQLEAQNSVVEPPFIATLIPNATSFNWGGGTLAATHLRIRGFDMDKQSVTVNGVPITDPEDHFSYWQDTPDLLSNVHDIQIERGVSSFTSGLAGLAGGVNLTTSDAIASRATELTLLTGTYNTDRRTFFYRSGLVENSYNFTGRFSRVSSDGYRDHSGGVEWSYFLSATRFDGDIVTNFQTWGGEEVTALDFTAVPRSTLDTNRTYNPEENYDLKLNGRHYDGEKDHFQQPHYVLRNTWQINPSLKYEQSLYWIVGNGFYEEYKRDRDFRTYDLPEFDRRLLSSTGTDSVVHIASSDLIRRKFVEKDEVGLMPRIEFKMGPKDDATAGLELRRYKSDHYGRVVWARETPPGMNPDHEYNRWHNKKTFIGGWGNVNHHFNDALSASFGIGVRRIDYKVNQDVLGAFTGYSYKTDWTFVNPRFGMNYELDPGTSINGSVAMSGLEPVDAQMFDPDNPDAKPKFPIFGLKEVKPQQMTDIELGGRKQLGSIGVGVNGYAMLFTDEIVYTGEWDYDHNQMVMTNAPTSQHLGVELMADWKSPVEGLTLGGDFSLDRSTLGDFTYYYVDGIDANWEGINPPVNVKGNRIPLTPSYVANGRIGYKAAGFSGTLSMQAVSRQYLDPLEDDRYSLDPYSTLNADLSYRLALPSCALRFQLNGLNLLGVKYEPYGWMEPVYPESAPKASGMYTPMFIPAAGRMLMGGVTVEL